MPRKPNLVTLEGQSVDILNAIRKDNGGLYQSMVPVAENTTDSIRQIGTIICGSSSLQNSFLSALMNRIGRVIISSKMYDNPWAFFKKGLLEFGETVEEIFVNIANPHQFNPERAESEQYKREKPDVQATFHPMNYQKFYKTTVQDVELRQAFLSYGGITDLIAKIIETLYTGASYDEFLTMKYLINRLALSGNLKTVEVDPSYTSSLATIFKATSTKLTFMSSDYNIAEVKTTTKKDDQYLIMNADLDAAMDVNVLASAFNMSKAEFMGHRVTVDSFNIVDNDRLAILFAEDPSFKPFTKDELGQLSTLQAVLVDKDWFMIFDNYENMTEKYNGEGLYWNYWYHVWKTFSVSPYANAVLFTNSVQTVTSVTVSPKTATLNKGNRIQLLADVVIRGFVSDEVEWTLEGNQSPNTKVDINGILSIDNNETSESITVKATSKKDNKKSDSAIITINQ